MFARLDTCIGPSARQEGCILKEVLEFVPFIYLGSALGMAWYKVLIWHDCRVH